MNKRKAFWNPIKKTSLSSFRSRKLIFRVQACLSSGFLTVFSKWKITARLYSKKKSRHSDNDGTLGGQVAVFPNSGQPKKHFILTHWDTTICRGSIHLKSINPCRLKRASSSKGSSIEFYFRLKLSGIITQLIWILHRILGYQIQYK